MDQTWNHMATSWVTCIFIVKKMPHGPADYIFLLQLKWPWDLYILFASTYVQSQKCVFAEILENTVHILMESLANEQWWRFPLYL